MGAWGTGVFENDTALDTIGEMADLVINYYKGLVESEDEHNIMLASFIYIATKDKDKAIKVFADPDQLLLNEIDFVLKGLSLANIEQFKYTLIGKLYKCLDDANEWNADSVIENRKAVVKKMIEYMTKED